MMLTTHPLLKEEYRNRKAQKTQITQIIILKLHTPPSTLLFSKA